MLKALHLIQSTSSCEHNIFFQFRENALDNVNETPSNDEDEPKMFKRTPGRRRRRRRRRRRFLRIRGRRIKERIKKIGKGLKKVCEFVKNVKNKSKCWHKELGSFPLGEFVCANQFDYWKTSLRRETEAVVRGLPLTTEFSLPLKVFSEF